MARGTLEASALLPNKPRLDNLRAHLENAGIAIGQCSRTPIISHEQLVAALGLSA